MERMPEKKVVIFNGSRETKNEKKQNQRMVGKKGEKVHKRKPTVSDADQDVSPLSEDAVHV